MMPFVKRRFSVAEEMPAFLYLIRQHHLTPPNAQSLIRRGRLLVDGISMVHPGKRICGDIELVFFEPASRGIAPVFETNDFALFEKSSGLLVHPKTMETEYSLLDEIRHFCGSNANAVHRIDMETSGIVMASKHKGSESTLKLLFEARGIQKSYLAWVDGYLDKPFKVDAPLLVREDYSDDKHKICVDESGKEALTYFEPLEYDHGLDATLLACYPHTGRTHQIRVHLFHVKHPILGDPLYGVPFKIANDYLDGVLSQEERIVQMGAPRLLLHAQSLKFHYGSEFEIYSKIDFRDAKLLITPSQIRKFNK